MRILLFLALAFDDVSHPMITALAIIVMLNRNC
jgi:hypothetical protein